MTTSTPVATASGPVLMSEQEARVCIDRIRANLEDVRALLLDLYEREGWKALGYASFVACAEAEFSASKSQAYRLLNAARLDLILSPTGENGTLPEAHLRELTPVADQPEAVRSIVTKVRELKGDAATAADVRDEVDQHLGKPVRATKPPKPVSPTRKSVSSRAEAGDFGDDAPAYAEQSQETYGQAPNGEQWCQQCGGKYRGEACLCASVKAPADDLGVRDDLPPEPADAPPDRPWAAEAGSYGAPPVALAPDADAANVASDPAPTAASDEPDRSAGEDDGYPRVSDVCCSDCGEPITVASEEIDRALARHATQGGASYCGDCADKVDQSDTDEDDGAAEPAGPGTAVAEDGERPASAARGSYQTAASYTISAGVGKSPAKSGSHRTAARTFGDRSLDAGDLSRALLDFPIDQVIEALAENATAGQKQALRQALGGTSQPTTTAATRSPAEIAASLGEELTVEQRASLAVCLIDALPTTAVGPIAHRAAVRVRPATTEPAGLPEVKQQVDALTPGQRMALVSHLFRGLDDEMRRAVQKMVDTEIGRVDDPAALAASWGR